MMVLMFYVFSFLSYVSALDTCPKCGSIDVPYPLSTADDCGDPRFRIYCNNSKLEFLSAEGLYYEILSITPSTYRLVISPPQVPQTMCYSSDLTVGGLSLDDNLPFNISSGNTVMLLNCSDSILLSPMNCSSNSFCRLFEEVGEGSGCKDTLCCHYLKDVSMNAHRIRVRVGGCTAYTSVVNVTPEEPIDSWNYGIELQWIPLA